MLTYALFPKIALDFFDVRKNGPAQPASNEAAARSLAEKAGVSQETRGRSGIYKVRVDGVAYRVVVEEGEGSLIEIACRPDCAVAEGVVEQADTSICRRTAGRADPCVF